MALVLLVPVFAALAAEPVLLRRVELSLVRAAQASAFTARDAGPTRLEFAGALDSEAVVWLKLRQGGRTAARPVPELRTPIEEAFPAGRFRLSAANGVVRAEALDGSGEAQAPVMALLDVLHQAALKVRFEPVEYAVLSEDGSLVPLSVDLLRRDHEGNYWVVAKRPEELEKILYFLAVNGVMFGMRLEGGSLAFYSKPVPDLPAAAPGGVRPLAETLLVP